MPFMVIEVDPKEVVVGELAGDDGEQFVYEHLRAYCATFDPLPAIDVKIQSGRFVLARGEYYLRIANELERPAIRAIIQTSGAESIVGFHRSLSREEVDAEAESAGGVSEAWHICYLENPAQVSHGAVLRQWFEDFVKASLQGIGMPDARVTGWRFDPKNGQVALRFPTPFGHHDWQKELMYCLLNLPQGKLVSYQGVRMPDQSG